MEKQDPANRGLKLSLSHSFSMSRLSVEKQDPANRGLKLLTFGRKSCFISSVEKQDPANRGLKQNLSLSTAIFSSTWKSKTRLIGD